jgi:hypothetical protein
MPSPATETLYIKSVNNTVEQYAANLRNLNAGRLLLDNKDFDTGKETTAGEYTLTDEAHAKLLDKLAERKFAHMTPGLRENILAFYEGGKVPVFAKKKPDIWSRTLINIQQLRSTGVEGASVR